MSRRFTFLLTLCLVSGADAESFDRHDGPQLMRAVYDRHEQYPYVYEEQSMIMIDQQGNKNTRKLRRYSRVNQDGTADFLLLFDSPLEIKGVALLARRDPSGHARQSFYLPAFGAQFLPAQTSHQSRHDDNFLGTDYSIENLVGDQLDKVRHIRRDDVIIDETAYYVVDVHDIEQPETGPVRRHYIRMDTLFITRTDHFDELGRLHKRQTNHDLVNVHGQSWRANMLMMENHQQRHRTVIKIDRRVFSADYVPEDVFSEAWILANQRPLEDDGVSL